MAVEASLCGLWYDSRKALSGQALTGKCSDEKSSGQRTASDVTVRMQSFPSMVYSDLDMEAGAGFGKGMSADVRGLGFLLAYQFG